MEDARCIQARIDVAEEARPALVDFLLGISPAGVVEGATGRAGSGR